MQNVRAPLVRQMRAWARSAACTDWGVVVSTWTDPRRIGPEPLSVPGTSLAGRTGLEPAASCVTGRRYNRLNYRPKNSIQLSCGRNRTRTCDIRLVRAALYQLSYPPFSFCTER